MCSLDLARPTRLYLEGQGRVPHETLATEPMQTPHRLKCAETWASNQATSSVADLPGLRAWVHSRPFGVGDAGGDVHYLSVCPSRTVPRIALADVSGHGRAVPIARYQAWGFDAEVSRGPGAGKADEGFERSRFRGTQWGPLRHYGGRRLPRAQRAHGDDECRPSTGLLVPGESS